MTADEMLSISEDPVPADLERRIVRFLYHEARLLQERRYREWACLLADDLVYRVPVRVTRPEGQGPEHSDRMLHFDDDRATIQMRIERFEGGAAWAEIPSSRCRYFISNVEAFAGAQPGLYEVHCNLLVTRLRGDDAVYEQLTGERVDVLRVSGPEFLIAQRTVLLDNTTLPMHNLALFL